MTSDTDRKDARIATLEKLVEYQACRIRELEGVFGRGIEPPPEWGLPRREAQIFTQLVVRERCTKEQLYTVIYGDEDLRVGPEIVESHISKMRKRLSPFGVRIESIRGRGYHLVDRASFRRSAS